MIIQAIHRLSQLCFFTLETTFSLCAGSNGDRNYAAGMNLLAVANPEFPAQVCTFSS
jgi:hypothetical protein